MKKSGFVLSLILSFAACLWASDYEKNCTDILNKVKNGETDVDYSALRLNCARSSWYKNRKQSKIDRLTRELTEAIRSGKHQEVKRISQSIVDANYLDMTGHKFLAGSLNILGDSTGAKFHRTVELGLLRSMAQSGSGKSCKDARIVIAVEEEYFMLRVMGWRLKSQSTVKDGLSTCDLMVVVDDQGVEHDEYFNVDIVFENYR